MTHCPLFNFKMVLELKFFLIFEHGQRKSATLYWRFLHAYDAFSKKTSRKLLNHFLSLQLISMLQTTHFFLLRLQILSSKKSWMSFLQCATVCGTHSVSCLLWQYVVVHSENGNARNGPLSWGLFSTKFPVLEGLMNWREKNWLWSTIVGGWLEIFWKCRWRWTVMGNGDIWMCLCTSIPAHRNVYKSGTKKWQFETRFAAF